MSAETHPATPEPNHLRRFTSIWLIASVIATPLVVLLLGPELPPGKATEQAAGQVTDNRVLLGMATPVTFSSPNIWPKTWSSTAIGSDICTIWVNVK